MRPNLNPNIHPKPKPFCQAFPLEIVALSQLKSLDIRANEIQSLPSAVGKMGGLEVLRVDCNQIMQLPVEMGTIFSLREFTFEGNELRTPPLEVLEHSTHAVLEYLKRMQMARKTQQLDLRALELRRTPVEVAFMTGLTSRSLENNQIQQLFVGFGQLTPLSELLLDYNELQTLPRTVANLTNLTKLSLAHNKIKHMTEWLLPRPPLRTLNACDNLIQELPYSLLKFTKGTALNVDMSPFTDPPREVVVAGQRQIFRYLKMLQEASSSNTLDLMHLGLLKFPVMHCEMTTLTALKLDYNLLEALPKELAKMLKLEVLTVTDNRLTHLPLELGYLRRLKTLETSGNDMKTPPPEVCNAPIFGIDASGLVNEWNNKAAEITGFSSDEVVGRDLVQDFITEAEFDSISVPHGTGAANITDFEIRSPIREVGAVKGTEECDDGDMGRYDGCDGANLEGDGFLNACGMGTGGRPDVHFSIAPGLQRPPRPIGWESVPFSHWVAMQHCMYRSLCGTALGRNYAFELFRMAAAVPLHMLLVVLRTVLAAASTLLSKMLAVIPSAAMLQTSARSKPVHQTLHSVRSHFKRLQQRLPFSETCAIQATLQRLAISAHAQATAALPDQRKLQAIMAEICAAVEAMNALSFQHDVPLWTDEREDAMWWGRNRPPQREVNFRMQFSACRQDPTFPAAPSPGERAESGAHSMQGCQPAGPSGQACPPATELVQVFVEIPAGRTLTIKLAPTASPATLKDLIEEKEGIPASQVRLVFGGRQLPDDGSLATHGVSECDTIVLSFRLCGGTRHDDGSRSSQQGASVDSTGAAARSASPATAPGSGTDDTDTPAAMVADMLRDLSLQDLPANCEEEGIDLSSYPCKGAKCWYWDVRLGTERRVEVVSVDHSLRPPSFVVKFEDGSERETEGSRLSLEPVRVPLTIKVIHEESGGREGDQELALALRPADCEEEARRLSADGHTSAAREMARRLAQAENAPTSAWVCLVQILHAAGEWVGVVDACQKGLHLHPDSPDLLRCQREASHLLHESLVEERLALQSTAGVDRLTTSAVADAQLNEGIELCRAGRPGDAALVLQAVILFHLTPVQSLQFPPREELAAPTLIFARRNLAAAFTHQRMFEEASKQLERAYVAMQLSMGTDVEMECVQDEFAHLLYCRAINQSLMRQFDDALEAASDALLHGYEGLSQRNRQGVPACVTRRDVLADTTTLLADLHLAIGGHEEAMRILQESVWTPDVEIDPVGYARAHITIGVCMRSQQVGTAEELREYISAISVLQRFVAGRLAQNEDEESELAQGFLSQAHKLAGDALDSMGRPDDAVQHYHSALEAVGWDEDDECSSILHQAILASRRRHIQNDNLQVFVHLATGGKITMQTSSAEHVSAFCARLATAGQALRPTHSGDQDGAASRLYVMAGVLLNERNGTRMGDYGAWNGSHVYELGRLVGGGLGRRCRPRVDMAAITVDSSSSRDSSAGGPARGRSRQDAIAITSSSDQDSDMDHRRRKSVRSRRESDRGDELPRAEDVAGRGEAGVAGGEAGLRSGGRASHVAGAPPAAPLASALSVPHDALEQIVMSLNERGRMPVDVPRDGHCMYSALAPQVANLTGGRMSIWDLRAAVSERVAEPEFDIGIATDADVFHPDHMLDARQAFQQNSEGLHERVFYDWGAESSQVAFLELTGNLAPAAIAMQFLSSRTPDSHTPEDVEFLMEERRRLFAERILSGPRDTSPLWGEEWDLRVIATRYQIWIRVWAENGQHRVVSPSGEVGAAPPQNARVAEIIFHNNDVEGLHYSGTTEVLPHTRQGRESIRQTSRSRQGTKEAAVDPQVAAGTRDASHS